MSNCNFDHDAWQESMLNPDREDTSRYEQAEREFYDAREQRTGNVVSTVRMITHDEWEQIKER